MSNKGTRKGSILRQPGAEQLMELPEQLVNDKLLLRAKRKDLKSATAKKQYENVITAHNKRSVASAKNSEVKIKKLPSRHNLKERVFS